MTVSIWLLVLYPWTTSHIDLEEDGSESSVENKSDSQYLASSSSLVATARPRYEGRLQCILSREHVCNIFLLPGGKYLSHRSVEIAMVPLSVWCNVKSALCLSKSSYIM